MLNDSFACVKCLRPPGSFREGFQTLLYFWTKFYR